MNPGMTCFKSVTVLITTICIFGELAGGQIFSREDWSVFRTMYRGMFHTKEEIKILMDRAAWYRKKLLLQESRTTDTFFLLPGDGGACCITDVVYIANETLLNVQSELQYLVIFYDENNQPLYQYFPHGVCIYGGSCNGRCLQEYVVHTLLVYDTKSKSYPPVKFDYFQIPSYCSCKNTI